MKWIISRQLPDSPPPLHNKVPLIPLVDLLVYVYTFSTLIHLLSKSTSFPQKTNRNAPLRNVQVVIRSKEVTEYMEKYQIVHSFSFLK